MNMAYHVIPFICLGLCLGTILVQGMQPGPRPAALPIPNQEFPRSTILSFMTSELTSVYGNCSFPPNDVLTNADSFDFLGRCDIKIPHLDIPISDEGVITCLGLLEVGLRLCQMDENYFKNDVLFAIPKDLKGFNSLLDDMNKQNEPNLCDDLKKVLDVVGENELSVINRWNIKNIFQESDESCTRICFDYKNNARLMCKLILWGSNLLIQTEPKPFESTIANGPLVYQPNLSHLSPGQDQTIKKISTPTPSTLDPDISVHQEVDELQESQENGHGSNKNEDTVMGIQLVASSSTATSLAANQADEGHMGQPMPILKSSDERPMETSSKSDVTKTIVSKLVPNQENQTPDVLLSEENMKNTDSLKGSRTSTTKHKQRILDGDTKKAMANPTSSIQALKPKDNVVSVDENSVVSPVEKTLPDISPLGDEILDHYDTSLAQNQDDEDLNFPARLEQPVNNQEPTGYKTDYKYPREEYANGNTYQERFVDSEDSHFFSYFMAVVVLCIVGYVVFHNKQKILALALEGRSKRGSRRRPVTANYHKLDNNLEEAVSSPCSTSVTHVIY